MVAQAINSDGIHLCEASVKHTVQMWTAWIPRSLLGRNPRIGADLPPLIAQLQVENRPGRLEPRVRKRRPKPLSS